MFLGANQHECATRCIPSSGTSYAVDVFVFAHGQVVVYYVCYVGDVESACCEVGTDKDVCRTIGKTVNGFLTFALLLASVEVADNVSLAAQELAHTLHAVSIVHEYDGLLIAEAA